MSDETPLERYQRMRTEDPDGPDAAALLRRLTVFENKFPSDAVEFVAPDTMTPDQQIRAFAALQRWGIVFQEQAPREDLIEQLVADNIDDLFVTFKVAGILGREIVERFSINETVKRAVRPDDQAYARHYAYYQSLYLQIIDRKAHNQQLIFDWPNVAQALIWGYDNSPYSAFSLFWKLYSFIKEHFNASFVSKTLLWMYRLTVRFNDVSAQEDLLMNLGAIAQQQAHYPRARHYYMQALALYETGQRNHPTSHIHLLRLLARLSLSQKQYSDARHHY